MIFYKKKFQVTEDFTLELNFFVSRINFRVFTLIFSTMEKQFNIQHYTVEIDSFFNSSSSKYIYCIYMRCKIFHQKIHQSEI